MNHNNDKKSNINWDGGVNKQECGSSAPTQTRTRTRSVRLAHSILRVLDLPISDARHDTELRSRDIPGAGSLYVWWRYRITMWTYFLYKWSMFKGLITVGRKLRPQHPNDWGVWCALYILCVYDDISPGIDNYWSSLNLFWLNWPIIFARYAWI